MPLVGSAEQGAILDNAFSLQRLKDKYETGTDRPVGRNFDFVSNNSGWMTGLRVFGDNMYITNRGNANSPTALTSNDMLLHKISITSTDGSPSGVPLNMGTLYTSQDAFDIDPTGKNLLIGQFHGTGGMRSATLADGFDLTSTFIWTGSQKSSSGSGVRAVSWGDMGKKYYMGYGTGVNASTIRQFTASTQYRTASGDTEGTAFNVAYDSVSDICFNRNGKKMYVSQNTGTLREYDLSTPWDPSTATLGVTFDVTDFFGLEGVSPARAKTDTNTNPWICGMHWNEDGSKLYINTLWGATDSYAVQGGRPGPAKVLGSNDAETGTEANRANTFAVIEFTIAEESSTTATYDLSAMSLTETADYGSENPTEITLSPYELSVAEIDGADEIRMFTYTGGALPSLGVATDTLTLGQSPRGMCFGNYGQYLYIANNTGNQRLVRRTLLVPYDIGSVKTGSEIITPDTSFNGGTWVPQGIAFKPDGSEFYQVEDGNIRVCTPTSAWDTSSFTNTSISVTGDTDGDGDSVAGLTGIRFQPDGTKMYLCYRNDPTGVGNTELTTAVHSKIIEYVLSTAWDPTTRSVSATLNLKGPIPLASTIGYVSFSPPAPPADPTGTGVCCLVGGFDWSEDGDTLLVISAHADQDTGEVRLLRYTSS